MDVHHARRRVGELVRCTHLLLLRLHEGRLPQRPGDLPNEDAVVSCVSIVPCEAPVALVCPEFSQNFIRERRPAADTPTRRICGRSARRAPDRPRGSTHKNVPDWPKCPKVRARVGRARPVRRLAVPDLEPQPPVVGPLRRRTRAAPRQARELHGRGLGVHLLATPSRAAAGRRRRPPGRSTVDVAPYPAASAPPSSVVSAMPSGSKTASVR